MKQLVEQVAAGRRNGLRPNASVGGDDSAEQVPVAVRLAPAIEALTEQLDVLMPRCCGLDSGFPHATGGAGADCAGPD